MNSLPEVADEQIEVKMHTLHDCARASIVHSASSIIWLEYYKEAKNSFDIEEAVTVLGQCILNDYVLEKCLDAVFREEEDR